MLKDAYCQTLQLRAHWHTLFEGEGDGLSQGLQDSSCVGCLGAGCVGAVDEALVCCRESGGMGHWLYRKSKNVIPHHALSVTQIV